MQKKGIKIEMSLIDDVKSKIIESKNRITSLKSAQKSVIDYMQQAQKITEKLTDEYRFADSLSAVVETSINNTEASLKELGIPATSIAELKELKSLHQQLLTVIVEANDLRNKIK